MICIPCTRGGILTTTARNAAEEAQAVLIKNAAELHAQCRGGTWCDCQHKTNPTGELNMALIEDTNATG